MAQSGHPRPSRLTRRVLAALVGRPHLGRKPKAPKLGKTRRAHERADTTSAQRKAARALRELARRAAVEERRATFRSLSKKKAAPTAPKPSKKAKRGGA